MSLRLNVANNASTTLSGGITSVATSLVVADASLFPAVPFRITIDAEIMEVSAVNTGTKTFTIVRAQEGTTAAAHNNLASVENRWTKGTYDEISSTLNVSRQAIANDVQITGTTAQNVATFTPSVKGNFAVYIYFRVITGTTNVTVTVTYADGTGAQTNTMINAQSSAVGSYSLVPLAINANSGTAINVNVTASVANQVYASASILGV